MSCLQISIVQHDFLPWWKYSFISVPSHMAVSSCLSPPTAFEIWLVRVRNWILNFIEFPWTCGLWLMYRNSSCRTEMLYAVAVVVLGRHLPLDHLVAYGMFTDWALLSFYFCTCLRHHVWWVPEQGEDTEAWDFNGNESEGRITASEKKNVFNRRNHSEKKKRINCVTGSLQLTALSKMEEKFLIK